MSLPILAHQPGTSSLQMTPVAPVSPLTIGVTAEQKLALLEYWRSLTKRKWALSGLALAAAVVAAAVAFSLTPIYKSTATVLIEPGKGKILSIQDIYADAIGGGGQQREYYQTQVEILKSRDVAERTVRALKLWEVPEFDPRKTEGSWFSNALTSMGIRTALKKEWTEEALTDATTVTFLKALTVEPVRQSQLVKVSFESADKEIAARVPNTLPQQYFDSDRESRFKISQDASSFLQDRLTSLRDKLTASERALQTYREQHGILNLGGSAQAPAGQQVNATTDRLITARARRMELESAYQQLKGVKNGDYNGSPIVMRDPAVMDAARQLADVNRRLAELSQTLGPRNDRILELEAQKVQISNSLAQIRRDVATSVTRDYEAARATEQSLDAALSSARGGVQSVNREEFQLAELDREVQTNRQLYDMFMSRAKETNLAGDVQASVGRVVDPAVISDSQYRPARLQIILVSALLALFVGAMASLLLDRLDNTVKGGEDAEIRLKQPVLAALPAVANSDRKRMALVQLEEPHSHFAEAVRTARTGILLSSIDHPNKVILVTSTLPGEGKTTVSINLALAHSQTKRTLLIDADMRRAQVGRSLRMAPNNRGLTNLVAGTASIGECVQKFKGSELFVMPVGDLPPNPLELLLSQRFREVLKDISNEFEMVIIDSPPVELVSEALVLSPLATNTVFVVKAMTTPAPLVRKSIQRIQRAGGNILGVIVNQLDFRHAQRYYGEYSSAGYTYGGYGSDSRIAASGLKPIRGKKADGSVDSQSPSSMGESPGIAI